MSYFDPQAEARSASAEASAATRSAAKYAQRASDTYAAAARWAKSARVLTQAAPTWRPELGYTPAMMEANAKTLTGCADLFLRMSFDLTDDATTAKTRAASYRRMAAERMITV